MTSREERNHPDTKAWIADEMNKVKLHFTGDHSQCEYDGEHCNSIPVIRAYPGKFSQKQADALVAAIFDKKYTSEKFLDQIANAGCTSINEAFHSMLVNRRLIVKGKNRFSKFLSIVVFDAIIMTYLGEPLHVLTGNYDAQVAAGSLIWNLGQAEAFRQTMDLVDWKLSAASIKKLEYQAKELKKKAEVNLQAKPAMRAKRIAKQNQYTDTSKYRTAAQQATDYARSVSATQKSSTATKTLPSAKIIPIRKSLRQASKNK